MSEQPDGSIDCGDVPCGDTLRMKTEDLSVQSVYCISTNTVAHCLYPLSLAILAEFTHQVIKQYPKLCFEINPKLILTRFHRRCRLDLTTSDHPAIP